MNPMDVLAPNYMGDSLENSGLDELVANRGLGVGSVTASSQPINEQGAEDQHKSANPLLDKLRTAKAREFGKTKEKVGF